MSLCASRDELREITGYKRKADVIRRLKEKRYPIADYDKDGWPLVPRRFVERRFQAQAEGPRLRLA